MKFRQLVYKILGVLILLLASGVTGSVTVSAASAATNAASMADFSLEGVEKILLQVGNAQVNLNGGGTISSNSTNNVAKASYDSAVFVAEKTGNVLLLKARDFEAKGGGDAKVLPLVEVIGKAQVELHGRDVRLNVSKWQGDILLQANSVKGSFIGHNGALNSTALKAELSLQDGAGPIKADFQMGKVNFRGGVLDGELSLLNGEIACEKSRGVLSIASFASQIKATGCGGSWSVDNQKGSTVMQNWEGRFEGSSQEGPFAVSVSTEGDVNIKTVSGRVTLTPPSTASVGLNFQTAEGDIVTPNYLKISKEGSKKYLKGRSQGEGEKGSFYVRTQDGVIFLK